MRKKTCTIAISILIVILSTFVVFRLVNTTEKNSSIVLCDMPAGRVSQ